MSLHEPPPNAYLTTEALDKWATDTNGSPFSEETKEELKDMLDVNDDGNLTYVAITFSTHGEYQLGSASFKGFLQIYQLQTENDEEETWKDLVR